MGSQEHLTTLWVNGEPRPYTPQTVAELLETLGLDPQRPGIAVAVNDAIVPRDMWAASTLCPGDRVEIVRAVAGGSRP
ncbi:MAG: sulfur carrier protein ThiS [Ardenticatenia bacterium]|nr:sulfur carrier protein ThiS [Ardenticatenia bacterium]